MLHSGSRSKALIEGGRIAQHLMQSVATETATTGFCPIGAIDASALSACLTSGLESNTVIHTVCFGPVATSSTDGIYRSSTDASGHTHAPQMHEQQGLRSHLSSELPQYMVPRSYVKLQTMPLTPNGKVDRRALEMLYNSIDEQRDKHSTHAIRMEGCSTGDISNLSPAEAELLTIWTE